MQLYLGLFVVLLSFASLLQAEKDFRAAGLAKHNLFRKKHGCPALEQDESMNKMAQDYANTLAASGEFKHSGRSKFGENLYEEFGSKITSVKATDAAVTAWYNESKLYDMKSPGFTFKTGHFTAMVWKSTTQVGIGVATVPDKTFGERKIVVANYFPAGNIVSGNEFKKNVPPLINQ